jgi:peptidoglycan/LPS O-acetylase OafA/YrhL
MLTKQMPKLAFQRQSPVGADCWHTVVISLLRGLAAIEVTAAHLRAAVFPGLLTLDDPSIWYQGLAFATAFSYQAVLVFFVLSGWLVGGSLLSKIGQPNAVKNYAIDRLTRLWTVLIPTFLLTLLFGVVTGVVDTGVGVDYSAANEYSALVFAGNLVGLQRVLLPDFGGNFPLWSLANETWYYVLFPLLVVLFTSRRNAARVACGAAIVLIAALLPVTIVLYFSLWLLGVAFSRIRIECSNGVRFGWLVLLLAATVYFRVTADENSIAVETFVPHLICSLMFLVFLSSLQFQAAPTSTLVRPVARIGKFIAEFSFSLYVLHVPLIGLLQHWGASFGLRQLSPDEPLHYVVYFGLLAILLLASYLAYLVFESQTYRIRRLVKNMFVPHAARQGAARAVPAEH